MGLTKEFLNFSRTPITVVRLLLMKILQIMHVFSENLTCHYCFKNKVVRKPNSGIPQPKYFNTWSDFKEGVTATKVFYINDVSKRYDDDEVYDRIYRDQNYDAIVKAYYPTKNTGFESINIKRTWDCSYWNPVNENNEAAFKKSDLLFADMMVNTQGIYKVKKVRHGTEFKEKVVLFFSGVLEKNRSKFEEAQGEKNIIDCLIDSENLFYLDYPVIR